MLNEDKDHEIAMLQGVNRGLERMLYDSNARVKELESANKLMHYQLYGAGNNTKPWARAGSRDNA